MMFEQWSDGKLVSRWNETTKAIETMAADGVTVASSTPMTPAQVAQADAYIAGRTATANRAALQADARAALTVVLTSFESL